MGEGRETKLMVCLPTTEEKLEKKKPERKPDELEEPEKTTTTTLEKKEPERKPDELEEPDKMTTTTPLRGRNETLTWMRVGSRNPQCALRQQPPTSLHATARPNRSLRAGSRNSRWTLEGGRWTVARCV